MSRHFSNLAQPLLTAAAFGAGVSVALSAARLSQEGGAGVGVYAIGLFACVSFVAASWLLSRPHEAEGQDKAPSATRAQAHGVDALEPDRAEPSRASLTEERADEDWREVSGGRDGLRRAGLGAGDVAWDE